MKQLHLVAFNYSATLRLFGRHPIMQALLAALYVRLTRSAAKVKPNYAEMPFSRDPSEENV